MKQNSTVELLGIAAHPDDVELSCAGTMLVAKRTGRTTGIVDLTRGELSTRGTLDSRAKETDAATKILQLDRRVNLDLPDGNIQVSRENMLRLVGVIRELRPSIVLAPHRYERHPDHEAASELARQASFYAGLKKIETRDENGKLQEPHRPLLVLHFLQTYSFEPKVIIDVSEVFGQRMEAVHAYGSQFDRDEKGNKRVSAERDTFLTQSGFYESIEAKARYFGLLIGVQFGEPFWTQEAVGVKDPFALLTKRIA